MKSEMPWAQSRNGSWAEGGGQGGQDGNMMWMDDKQVGGTPWNEPPQTPTPWATAGSKPKTPTTPSWGGEADDGGASWGQPPKQGPKPLAKEMIWASKQFKILSEMGFKRDDVENVLRACNMVMEDALEMLRSGRSMAMESSWHRPNEDHNSTNYDPMGHHASPYPPGQRFNPSQQMPFVHPGSGSGAHHLLNNPNSALGLNPNPAFKILQQQQPPPIPPQVRTTTEKRLIGFGVFPLLFRFNDSKFRKIFSSFFALVTR